MRLVRDYQRKKKMEARKKLAKGVAVGTLVGGVVGSTLGVLLAPDSGKNTRKKIVDNTVEMKNSLEKNIEETKGALKETKDNLKGTLVSKKSAIRDSVERIRKMRKSANEDVAVSLDTHEETTEEAPKGDSN